MDARRPRHLGDAGDGHLHVGGRDEHEVGQFVNNNNDVTQIVGYDDLLLARDGDFVVQLHGEALGTGFDFFPAGEEG